MSLRQKPYFEFKGKSNRSFTGLMVSELPPISKPPKRFNKISIDGRDGDIVEFLGYDAYDKEIQVGLTTGYDIDAIFEWLEGKGKLVLSNEPSKAYYAEILDGIDFERLVTFRKGIIRFHVQPYKYERYESQFRHASISASGTLTVTNKGNTEALPELHIYGRGTMTLTVNGSYCCTISFGSTYQSLTLYSESEKIRNGQFDEDGELRTSMMSGDFPVFQKGENTIEFSVTDGTLNRVYINKYSRWL